MESKKDLKRVGSIFAIVVSATVLAVYGIKLISGESSITGAAVRETTSSGAAAFIIPLIALIVLVSAVAVISRINR